MVPAIAQAAAGAAGPVANVNRRSPRLVVTPDRLQGRVTAGHRFLDDGAYPLGSQFGGWLGGAVGLHAAITVCAAGAALGPLWAIRSPVRRLRQPPSPAPEPVVGA